ncbi:MAG TPA: hypothetical protein VHC47_02810 [Mucilaginibacter sp.]|nr:hypothetical protein [Mucilaginibacter sp.]
MKPLLFFILLCFLVISCNRNKTGTAKLSVSKLNRNAIPASVSYKGDIDTAIKYTDGDGDHILIATESYAASKGDDFHRITGINLHAYCYRLNADKWQRMWEMTDSTDECDLDVAGGFLKKGFVITDLNQDGRGEVWLMYHLACRGNMSPDELKIVMHEGDKKYAMHGESRVKVSVTEQNGGDYEFDAAFSNGPDVFRQYAEQLWGKNRGEKPN